MFGPIAVFGGGLFVLDGGWQVYNDYIQRTRWTPVNAQVQACSIYDYWDYAGTPKTRHAMSKNSYVRCTLRYPVGDIERENTVKVGDAISTYANHRPFLASKLTLTSLHSWISSHRSGSFLSIHYDPANPDRISLSPEDYELKEASPYERLWLGLFFCAMGLAIIAMGKLWHNRSLTGTQAV